jgi:uncharacterized repeat protein (TIGR03806 family)
LFHRQKPRFALLCVFVCPLLATPLACGGGGTESEASGAGGAGGRQVDQSGGVSGQAGNAGGASVPSESPFAFAERPPSNTCVAPARPTNAQNDPFPKRLSDTGCVEKSDPTKPAAGLIPYGVNSALWSDDADKGRWVAIPAGKTIVVKDDGHWDLPVGTVAVKEFRVKDKLVETRLLVHHSEPDDWVGYSYAWRPDGKDADLVDEDSKRVCVENLQPNCPDENPDGQMWVYPSRMQCLGCHGENPGRSLGLETAQLNRLFLYPNGKYANQIATFAKVGLLATSNIDPKSLPAYANPADPKSGTLSERARSYLQSNCAHCHRPGATMESTLDFRYTTPLREMNACDVKANKNNFGDSNAKLLAPGDGESSIVFRRTNTNSPFLRMPQIGRSIIDPVGSRLVGEWITSLKSCN